MTDESLERTRRPEFWQRVYDEGEAPWDLGEPSPVLRGAVALGLLPAGARVLVPGCGTGHDAVFLAECGFDVVACDFAESAIEATRKRAAQRGVVIDARRLDIFELFDEPSASFDAIFEYTCYCAIDPALRDRYVELATHLVRPTGSLLFLAFPLDKETPGPPHGIRIGELRDRFEGDWRWILDTQPSATPEPRRGKERLVLMERAVTG